MNKQKELMKKFKVNVDISKEDMQEVLDWYKYNAIIFSEEQIRFLHCTLTFFIERSNIEFGNTKLGYDPLDPYFNKF